MMNPLASLVNFVILIIVYFGIGLIRDGLGTLYYRSISRQWELSASSLAGAITLYDILVLATIAKQGWPMQLAVAYALGCGVGTLIAMKVKK